MGRLFLMKNPYLKFQNSNIMFRTDAQTDGWMDGQTDGRQAQSNMSPQLRIRE